MPLELPPPPPAVILELRQDPQPPLRIPQTDIEVTVVGQIPLRTKLEDVSRLLGQRHMKRSINRTYPPTILEIIKLVERNPAKPVGLAWNSIRELTIGYDPDAKRMSVAYCLDYCSVEPQTAAPHPRRKMAFYSAPERLVTTRLDKKLGDLKKYAPR